ncbi:MAG: MFS transporter, partial [Bryobacteraceae bacterium]
RKLLRVFQVPGLIVVPLVFLYPAVHDLDMLKIGVFFAGLLTVAQFSFWGNYLPRVYPLYLRGTGESFAANVGGRMVGTSMAMVTTQLSNVMVGTTPSMKLAYSAACVALLVYAIGFLASFHLPEPQKDTLPD